VSKWTTREGVDNAIRERDVEYIVHAIRHPETPQEVRDYLADFVRDFPNGKAKFSRRRPKRRGLEWERLKIAERVWWVKKSKGLKKTSSAVDEVAVTSAAATRMRRSRRCSIERIRSTGIAAGGVNRSHATGSAFRSKKVATITEAYEAIAKERSI
jgi:hypothetical protein